MDFKKKLVQLKQEEEMDAKEKAEADKDGKKNGKKGDNGEQSFEEKRKEVLKEAEEWKTEEAPHPAKESRVRWNMKTDIKGPIGLLMQSVRYVGAELTEEFV